MNLVIAATSSVAIPTIERLRSEHSTLLITMPDSRSGRGRSLTPSEVAMKYPDALKPENEAELSELLVGKDLLLTIGYGRILKRATLSIPKYGGINLHFSLLPKWRGAAPVQRCIEAGDEKSGVTVFQMDSGMDTGPIWHQIEYEIPRDATSSTLFRTLADIGSDAVINAIQKIVSGGGPMNQVGEPTYAAKITKSECQIDWNTPAIEIDRKIRAFGENPGVTTLIRGSILKLNEVSQTDIQLPPSCIDEQGRVGTGTTALQLKMVTPAGKREMSVRDWLNGFKPIPGERFES